MTKRIVLVIVLLAGITTALYFGFRELEQEVAPVSDAINAVPSDAAFIFETHDAHAIWSQLTHTNVMWEELRSAAYFERVNRTGKLLDSLILHNESLRALMHEKSVLISTHMSGANNFSFLLSTSLPSALDKAGIDEFIKQEVGINVSISARTYDETTISNVSFPSEDLAFSYAVKDGVFMASLSASLVEDAIRHLKKGVPLSKNDGFTRVQRTAGHTGVDANLYINYRSFPFVLGTYMNSEAIMEALPLSAFASWSELDVTVKPNALEMDGFTYSNDTINNYLNIYKGQEPQALEIASIAPLNSSVLLEFGVSDLELFRKSYLEFLEKNNKLFEYQKQLDALNSKCQCNAEVLLLNWITERFGLIVTEPSNAEIVDQTFAVFHSDDAAETESLMLQMLTNLSHPEEEEINVEVVFKEYQLHAMDIEMPYYHLLGGAFKNIQTPHFVVIEDYLVFGNSYNALRDFIRQYTAGKTLGGDLNYIEFSESITNASNVFAYSNISRSPYLYQKFVTEEHSQDIETNLELYRKFEGVAFQLSNYKNDLFLNNFYLKYNPVYKQETSLLWEAALDTTASMKPALVVNHYSQTKEVFVQDNNNTIYLISTTGTVLWKKQLPEKIIGEVHQIDVLKNNKLQLLFSTASNIYLLDRNGKAVTGFPIALIAPATTGVCVMDYDHNREYRLLIPTADNKVYNYDRTGALVTGWEFTGTSSPVVHPIKHLVIKNKDYIFVNESNGQIHLLDRRGRQRHQASAVLTNVSKNSVFVEKGPTIDACSVIYASQDGQVFKTQISGNRDSLSLAQVDSAFSFEYVDLNQDDILDYVFLSGNQLSVYDGDGSLLFTHEFESDIQAKPLIYQSEKTGTMLGVVSATSQEVFLFNQFGDIKEGTPLFGTSAFSVADLNSDGYLNLVTTGKDGSVYTYTLKN